VENYNYRYHTRIISSSAVFYTVTISSYISVMHTPVHNLQSRFQSKTEILC